jgi:Ca-activated chloride channel family protein
MKTLGTIYLVVTLLPALLFSQYASLKVQHPQRFTSYNGTIEEARLVVIPKGVYTQNDLYLTFSARGVNFSAKDSVEVILDFELPRDCAVNDLWLWIDEQTISHGLILDRWTATMIYENIVRRRRDPALLTKSSSSSQLSSLWELYQLRVYPMLGNGSRKVKISYLVPAQWTHTGVSSFIPAQIFRVSNYKPSFITVDYKQELGWGSPRIAENVLLQFSAVLDTSYGRLLRCRISSDNFSSFSQRLNLFAGSPMKNGIYLARRQQGNDGFYHLAVHPLRALELQTSKKVVFLFDYDSLKTSLQKTDILYNIRSHLESNYSAADSFNLIFTQHHNILSVGNKWFSADLYGIAQAFQLAGPSPIVNRSNLPELIKAGIDFLKQNDSTGVLCLVASSDRLGDYRTANPIITEILRSLPAGVQISVIDLLNRNFNSYFYNNKYYYGNDYFYEHLTKLTRGYWAGLRASSNTLPTMLTNFTHFTTGAVEAFDIYPRLENGLCYSRFTSGVDAAQSVSAQKPVTQVGKFRGSGSFIIDVVGIYKGVVRERRIVVPQSDIAQVDTFASKAWTGRYIASLENTSSPPNSIVSQIIEVSLKQRVLSRYTAFLALEPNDTIRTFAPPSGGPGGPTSVEEQANTASEEPLLQAYPNPFNAQTTIRIRLPRGVTSEQVRLQIYNSLGQVVRTFSPEGLSDRQITSIIWNGQNNEGRTVASGVYFFVFSSPKGVKSLKLMVIK